MRLETELATAPNPGVTPGQLLKLRASELWPLRSSFRTQDIWLPSPEEEV